MLVSKIMIGGVAVIHAYLGWVEITAWTTKGQKFLNGMPPDTFKPSTILAKNMGVYNWFLAVGLAWALIGDQAWQTHIALFFLTFVSIAGVVGACTADRKLFLAQSVPALLGIAAILLKW